jgi:3'(2'), 5'-bisphosphate nucleotidase
MDKFDIFALTQPLIATAFKAGQVEMEIYGTDFSVDRKSDNSPVTEADQLAENIILDDLARLAPKIPVIAEEAASAGHLPETGDVFFLVDPLDGTKEFVSRNGEFTVNIALIAQGKPVFGIIYAPAKSQLYATFGPDIAMRAELDIDQQNFDASSLNFQRLQTAAPAIDGLNVIASRSHMGGQTRSYLDKLTISSLKNAGSSLKFCRIAEGVADIYPRFAPTMEWDTAAGHAILLAAGGEVVTIDGMPLAYGKREEKYLNPCFIAHGRPPKTKAGLS